MTIESLTFKNLSFTHPNGGPGILEDASFEFPADQNILISGATGSGRSTLMKVLVGLNLPTSGQFLINGQDVAQMSFEEFLPLRKKIGYSFDFGGLMANRMIRDNLMLPLLYHEVVTYEEALERVHTIMDYFKILDHKDSRPASVSGATRKSTVVARAFVMNPEMIVMDDPFVALDSTQCERVVRLIQKFRETQGLRHVFFTTRDQNYAQRLGCVEIQVENKQIVINDTKLNRRVASL